MTFYTSQHMGYHNTMKRQYSMEMKLQTNLLLHQTEVSDLLFMPDTCISGWRPSSLNYMKEKLQHF